MNSITLSDSIDKQLCSSVLSIATFTRVIFSAITVLALMTAGSIAATIDVTAYGANGNDTLDDTANIQSAVAALNENDTLLFPECSNYYRVNIGSGQSLFVITTSGVRVLIRGRILAFGTPVEYDWVFYVTANNVEFVGEGGGAILEGSGQYNYYPGHFIGPTLINFHQVNGCTVRDLTLRNGPQSSIFVRGGTGSKIVNCFFEGGPTTIPVPAIFGIYGTGVYNLLVEGNRFAPNATGGKAHSWIFFSSTSSSLYVTITNNKFEDSFDHAIYLTGLFYSVVSNNTVHGGASGGPNSALKTTGTDNVIINNTIYDDCGGIEINNGSRNIVANNIIDGYKSVAIINYAYAGGSGGNYSDNIIEGNFIRGNSAGGSYEAIRCWGLTVSGTKITGNTILNSNIPPYNSGSIVVYSSASPGYNISITDNIIDHCGGNGIYFYNIHDSLISDNIINVPVGREQLVVDPSSSNYSFIDNLTSKY